MNCSEAPNNNQKPRQPVRSRTIPVRNRQTMQQTESRKETKIRTVPFETDQLRAAMQPPPRQSIKPRSHSARSQEALTTIENNQASASTSLVLPVRTN